jgi:hypothetical protein
MEAAHDQPRTGVDCEFNSAADETVFIVIFIFYDDHKPVCVHTPTDSVRDIRAELLQLRHPTNRGGFSCVGCTMKTKSPPTPVASQCPLDLHDCRMVASQFGEQTLHIEQPKSEEIF